MKKKKVLQISLMGLVLALLLAANGAAVFFYELITVYLGGYGIDTSNIDFTKTSKIAEDIEAEGIILLKNENIDQTTKSLPLSGDEEYKVNVFGWSSIDPAYTGGGSGSSSSLSLATSFYDALEENNISYNTDLVEAYRSYKAGRESTNYWSDQYPYLNLIEPDISYIEPLLDSAYDYSSTALVFITRLGGEHQDLPKTQVKWNSTEDTTRTYLDVTTEEEELIKTVGQKFDNTIVIVNSINAMNLSYLDSEYVDSALYVGAVGQYGTNAIAKMLKGEIAPSGKTVDTYAYDLSTAATYISSPDGHNIDGATGVRTYDKTSKLGYMDKHYIDYNESIYVGYRWYETADSEGFWDSEYAKEKWNIENGYEDVVQYPFGYGLSYTDFDWEINSISPAPGSTIDENTEITIKVTVKNVGDHKGADVVQVYYGSEYKNTIEKASKNLVAYDKTNVLDPKGGEKDSHTLTLSFKASDMRSYDYNDANNNGFTGYELESGKYNIYISTDAHNPYSSDKAVITYNVANDIKMNKVDGATVGNLFTGDEALDAGISIDGTNTNSNILYMTRNNFEETFPAVVDLVRAKTNNMPQNGKLTDLVQYDEKPIQGIDSDLRLYVNGEPNMELIRMLGADYDDDNWEALLDQMSVTELETLVTQGGYRTAAVDSIGKPEFIDLDGPLGLNDSVMTNNSGINYTFYPGTTVLAQTWNDKTAYTFGLTVGYEASQSGISGWYAPACNIHRSPFGGRNFEYYSEDTYISGMMAANVIKGATNNGTYCYLKHFAVNETASIGSKASAGLYTWLTEQALREIYLKSFEIAVKVGDANAIMAAYNRIGATWCGGSYALMTGVLREEWGFKGSVVTDAWTMGNDLYSMEQGIRVGTNMLLNSSRQPYGLKDTNDATTLNCLRNSAHDILYTYCNTIYRQDKYITAKANGENVDSDLFDVQIQGKNTAGAFPYWLLGLIAIDIAAIAGLTVWTYMLFFKKKDENPTVAE